MSFLKGILFLTFYLVGGIAFAQDLSAFGLPAVTSVEELNGETTYSLSLQILILMTALTVLPSLVLGMTAFTRIIMFYRFCGKHWETADTPKSSIDSGSSFSQFLCYESNF